MGLIPIRPMGSEGGRSDGKNEVGSNLRFGSRKEKKERVERVGRELREGVIRELDYYEFLRLDRPLLSLGNYIFLTSHPRMVGGCPG